MEPGVPEDVANVDLPQFRVRRKHTAQGPLAVVQAFDVHTRVILPRLLGLRMCPKCPHCNAEGANRPCQDIFGSNMRPMGGIVGAAEAFGGAVENQRLGSPHLHSHVGVASAFQHNTLHVIAQMVEVDLIDLGDVYDYRSWVCCEDHLVPEQHEAELPQNEREFPEYSAAENDALCKLPLYIAKDDCGTMWDATNPMSEKAAREEGNTYRHTYFADVQFVLLVATAPLAQTREGEGRGEGRRMEAPHVL